MAEESLNATSVELATELTIAWLSNPNTRAQASDVSEFLTAMHSAVEALSAPSTTNEPTAEVVAHVPAVTPRRSLASKEHIISLIDGKPYKTLRRHLSTHGLSPDEYRARYGLKPDYPIVAPAYAEVRRAMAKKIGLGRKPGQKSPAKSPAPATPAKRRGRRPTPKIT